MTAEPTPSNPPAMTKPAFFAVLGACVATLLLAILDINIVTNTGAAIARDIDPHGGISQVPWLGAIYALVATVAQPLYGKLADSYGPKVVFLGTVALFIVGSLLCAAAISMPELLAFRAVQGLGGGGLLSVTVVILGHLRAEHPEISGDGGNAAAGLMVGLGLVAGPLLGGTLVAHGSWRWIFLINIPLAACRAPATRAGWTCPARPPWPGRPPACCWPASGAASVTRGCPRRSWPWPPPGSPWA